MTNRLINRLSVIDGAPLLVMTCFTDMNHNRGGVGDGAGLKGRETLLRQTNV